MSFLCSIILYTCCRLENINGGVGVNKLTDPVYGVCDDTTSFEGDMLFGTIARLLLEGYSNASLIIFIMASYYLCGPWRSNSHLRSPFLNPL